MKNFLIGAISMLIFVICSYMIFTGTDKSINTPSDNTKNTVIPSDTVVITPLPPLLIIRGTDVAFEGKVELRQAIAGRFAKSIVITDFQATGEHSEKSVIKIVWENGEVEKVYPGTKDKRFLSDKKAVEISIAGYSMHERPIFKDSSRKGILNWEIRYEPVNL